MRRSVGDFARGLQADLGTQEGFSTVAWKRCAEFGIQGLPIPTDLGGQGADGLTTVMAFEEMGRHVTDAGLLFSLNAQLWSVEMPLLRFGSEQQKHRYLPSLCDGSLLAAHGMTEPGSGSDAMALATQAERDGDGYRLTGTKTFVTNAPVADLFMVFATVDPSRGWAGITGFLLERDTPGLEVGKPFSKMGLVSSPMSELHLDGCLVGPDALLGRDGSGMAVFNNSMEWERTAILATGLGTMQRQLDRCVDHAKQRRQFGRPIGEFQAVSHRIAEMAVRLESARLLTYKAAWLKASGNSAATASAMAKLAAAEAFLQSSLDALQTFGAYGYMAEYGFEREVRDAVAGRIYSGTSDIQRNLIAKGLGL